ncbi:MAG: phosphotransferase [Bacteroidota bacterium]
MTKTLFTHQDKSTLSQYLVGKGLIQSIAQIVEIEKVGDSNMNFTVRVKLIDRSFILKQSKPYVEKYPQIPAPENRVSIEGQFYDLVGKSEALSQQMPNILYSDHDQDVLILEDLGELSSYEKLYAREKVEKGEIEKLIDWLRALHLLEFSDKQKQTLENREMRLLNHEHIFDLPLKRENGIDLDQFTPGLQEASEFLKKNELYVNRVKELGELYLKNGHYLLHGDYYPASWLKKEEDLFIIDAEFAFFGVREFDLGVMLGHLILSRQNQSLVQFTHQCYSELDESLVNAYAGVEIMRRLIGVAQLPIQVTLDQKKEWLKLSEKFVLG